MISRSTTPYGQPLKTAVPELYAPTPFFGRCHPHADLLIVWGAAVGKIGAVEGFEKQVWGGCEVFHSSGVGPLNCGLLLGIRKHAGKLIIGPKALNRTEFQQHFADDEGIGQYLLLGLLPENGDGPERVVLSGDYSGMVPVYVARQGGSVLVSNHLHLLAQAMVAAGLPVRLCKPSVVTNWVSDITMFMHQVLPETLVKNVRMCMPGDRFAFGGGRFEHSTRPSVEATPVTKDEYWDHIREGAKEIRSNIEAAANCGIPLFSTLTGGRDSRVFYAGIRNLGLAKEIPFMTGLRSAGIDKEVPFTTFVGNEADAEVASGLVSRVGGHFGRLEAGVEIEAADPVTELLYHRSAFLGSYGTIKYPFSQRTDHVRSLIMVGGFGEGYRSYYPNRYKSELMQSPFNSESVRLWLLEHPFWPDRPSDFFEIAHEHYMTHFANLPGDTLQQKLASQLGRFENRIHFGLASTGRYYPDHVFFPLHAPSLLKLVPRMDFDAMRLGIISFHVARELCEEAPYLPYNKPLADVASHPFHTPCQYDAMPPSFSPDMTFFINSNARKKPEKSINFPTSADYSKAVLDMIDRVIGELQDHPEGRTYLTPSLIKRIYWLKDRPLLAHRAWLARLAGVRDVLYMNMSTISPHGTV